MVKVIGQSSRSHGDKCQYMDAIHSKMKVELEKRVKPLWLKRRSELETVNLLSVRQKCC